MWCHYPLYKTHLHICYLIDKGKCGWQGEIQDLENSQKLKEENRPSTMLAIADHWLGAELDRNRRSRMDEISQGELAHSLDPTDH